MTPYSNDYPPGPTLDVEFETPTGHSAPNMRLIPAATVREIFGSISDMTLWRWLKDESLRFPQPIILSRNRYWREAEVQAWIEQRASKQAKSPAA